MIRDRITRRALLCCSLAATRATTRIAHATPSAAAPILGCYVGNPNGNDSSAMAAFEADFDRFSKTLSARPAFMNAFIDFGKPFADWAPNVDWTAWSWSQSSRAR